MLFQNFEKFIEKFGYATAAAFLGHRDTGRVKNWIKRKEVPDDSAYSVDDMIENITVNPTRILKEIAKKTH